MKGLLGAVLLIAVVGATPFVAGHKWLSILYVAALVVAVFFWDALWVRARPYRNYRRPA